MGEFAIRTEADFKEVHAEIRSTRSDLGEEIGTTRAELSDQIRATRAELRCEIHEVRDELEDDIEELRIEMNGRFAGIEQRFDILFGALATGFVGALAPHFIG